MTTRLCLTPRGTKPLMTALVVLASAGAAQDQQHREGPVRFDPPASLAARPASDDTALPSDPDTGASQRVTAEQAASEQATRERLNREQAEFADRQLAENAAARQAYEAAQREREANIARQQAEYRAAIAQHARDHAAAMEQWRSDVAACNAGDRSRCSKETGPQ